MAMKEQPRKVYRSMQGKEIELDKLIMRNETTLAVGNAKVNARGDELGPGGKIVRKKEDIMTEYNARIDSVPAPKPKVQPETQSPEQPSVDSSVEKVVKPTPRAVRSAEKPEE